MDLPERVFAHKVSSRVGRVRVPFAAYSVPQLVRIVRARLEAADAAALFDSDAVEFCARKVAGISGDARRALDICSNIISDMFASPAVRLIQHLPLHQLALLLAVAKIARLWCAFEQYGSYCLRLEPERSERRHELQALVHKRLKQLLDR
ncbi:Origin recognition complex, subunit 1 [Cladochytrium tenue]|nr:Origin recognition complex, subunit 1 [Cladochytrium tenue]